MKSRVGYPRKPFASITDAQAWVDAFVRWHNEEHRRSGLNWVTPTARNTGKKHALLRRRAETYRKARQRHLERWSRDIRNGSHAPPVTLNPAKKKRSVAQAA